MPVRVDRGGRHDDEVDVVDGHRPEQFADGFGHAVQAEHLVSSSPTVQSSRPSLAGDGEQDADAPCLGPVHEGAGVRLGGHRQVARDRLRAGRSDQLFESRGEAGGRALTLVAGMVWRRSRSSARRTRFWTSGSSGMPHILGRRDRAGPARRLDDANTLNRMTDRITKAVIPAAGLGTRFLPATKAMPKEMLPVVDKPAIQYVVEEAVAAGLDDVLMITGRNKNALENHFDRVAELESTLETKGDNSKLEKVQESTDLADVHYVRQGDPKGLGHAVLRARKHVGNEPFAVLLGDDIIDARDPLLITMLEEHARRNATIVALLEVDPGSIHLYGAAAVEPTDDPDVVRITGLVEKPAAEVRTLEPRRHRALRAAARGLRRPRAHRARQGRRDPAHRRAHGDGRRRRGHGRRVRRRLPRPPLRHRRQARLHQGGRSSSRATATTSGPICAAGWSNTRPDSIQSEHASSRPADATRGRRHAPAHPGARREAARAGADGESRLAATVGGDVPGWRIGHRHAREHPQPARARTVGPRAAVHRRARRRARRPAQRLVDHVRLALVGVDRLLGGARGRRPGHHPHRGRARDRLLLRRRCACIAWRSASVPRTSRRCGSSRSSGSATRGFAAGSSTSTATGATTSRSRSSPKRCRAACCAGGARGAVPDDAALINAEDRAAAAHPLRLADR